MTLKHLLHLSGVVVLILLMVRLVFPLRSFVVVLATLGFVGISSFSVLSQLARARLCLPSNALSVFLTLGAFGFTARATGMEYYVVRNDLFWIVVASAVSVAVVITTSTREDLDFFLRNLTRGWCFIALASAVIGLGKLFLYVRGYQFDIFLTDDGTYIGGTSTTSEYNTYSYALTVGLACGFWIRRHEPSVLIRRAVTLALPVIVLAMILTGSRRAWLFLVVGVAGILLIGFLNRRSARVVYKVDRFELAACAMIVLVVAYVIYLDVDKIIAPIRTFLTEGDVSWLLERSATLFSSEGTASRQPYFSRGVDLYFLYSWMAMLFGGGFSYVTQFNPLQEDYPHNFILSSLLYGGVLQTVILMIAVGHTWMILWRAKATLAPLLYAYTATIIFALFSSNSFFSMPLATFFLLFGAHPLFESPAHTLEKVRTSKASRTLRGTGSDVRRRALD